MITYLSLKGNAALQQKYGLVSDVEEATQNSSLCRHEDCDSGQTA